MSDSPHSPADKDPLSGDFSLDDILGPDSPAASVEPVIPEPVDPVEPAIPVSAEPVAPAPAEPAIPVSAEPVALAPAEPVAPAPAEPVAPAPAEPVAPSQDLGQIQDALNSIQQQLAVLSSGFMDVVERVENVEINTGDSNSQPALPRAHAAEAAAAQEAIPAPAKEAIPAPAPPPNPVQATSEPDIVPVVPETVEQTNEIDDPFARPDQPVIPADSSDPFSGMAAGAFIAGTNEEDPIPSPAMPEVADTYQPPFEEAAQAYEAPIEEMPMPAHEAPIEEMPMPAHEAPIEEGAIPENIVDPNIYQEIPIAAQPVPSDDFDDINVSLPADSPLASEMDDYTPAYADVDSDRQAAESAQALDQSLSGQEAPTSVDYQGPRPVDILVSIAQHDPETEADHQAAQSLTNMREDAVSAKKSRRGGKMTLPPLPLDSLVRGTPVIGTVFSPSGGVGKTSTAMNLAAYIAAIAQAMADKKAERGETDIRVPRVLVLDGDMVQGSLALRLKGETTPSIHDLMLYLDDREEQGMVGSDRWPAYYEQAPAGEKAMREFVMWRTDMPNLNLLAAPEEPDLFYDFGAEEYREILQMLGRFYDIIIIDAGTEIVMESQRAWLQHSNEVFMITAPEVDRIYNAAKAARYIAKSRPHPKDQREEAPKLPPLATREKLSVVMTRFDADSGIDPEKAIAEYFSWIPEDQRFFIPDVSGEMLLANNHGEFLVLNNPDYAKVINFLAQQLFTRYSAARQKALSRG